MSKKITEKLSINLLFEEVLKPEENVLKIKDILLPLPSEISDIFDICKNEIQLLSNTDRNHQATEWYTKIYFDCLIQQRKLMSYGNIDMIGDVRKSIKKSNDENEALLQLKDITRARHLLGSSLLRMVNEYKPMDFVDDKLKQFGKVVRVMMRLIETIFTGKEWLSANFTKTILNAKIKIG